MGHGRGLESKNDQLQSRQTKELSDPVAKKKDGQDCPSPGKGDDPIAKQGVVRWVGQGSGERERVAGSPEKKVKGWGRSGGFFGILAGECRTDRAGVNREAESARCSLPCWCPVPVQVSVVPVVRLIRFINCPPAHGFAVSLNCVKKDSSFRAGVGKVG